MPTTDPCDGMANAQPGLVLSLDTASRARIWQRLTAVAEDYAAHVADGPVTPVVSREAMNALLEKCAFDRPMSPDDALELTVGGLLRGQVHTAHPCYFGLFTPAPAAMAVVADALTALFNPQLAGWSHSPFAVQVEHHVIQQLARRAGWDSSCVEGMFTTGGSEANHTAVLCALTAAFPSIAEHGLASMSARPVLYVSSEVHGSIQKAVRLCGLGTDALRYIRTDADWRMDPGVLEACIDEDRRAGFRPFMVVATAGTTTAGAIDPIQDIAAVTRARDLWLHVDGAWGGVTAFVPNLRHLTAGLTHADSLTVDAHKWLAVPVGAGIYLSPRHGVLRKTFAVDAHAYAPERVRLDGCLPDPYQHSIQWSRRFIGLKLFMSLLVAGWDGYADVIMHQVTMGDHLRSLLRVSQWRVVNNTKLPLVCFVDDRPGASQSRSYMSAIARAVVTSGEAWLSTVTLGTDTSALRACITNYQTQRADIRRLVNALNEARDQVRNTPPPRDGTGS